MSMAATPKFAGAGTRRGRGGGASVALSALLLSLTALLLPNAVVSQDPPPLEKTGPQPCSSDPSILGYENSTSLTVDMLLDHDAIVDALMLEGNPAPTYDDFLNWQEKRMEDDLVEWLYVLCPNTTFDMGDVSPAANPGEQSDPQTAMPIVPFVPNSVIRCGNDGNPLDNCVVTGGLFQVVFEDDHLVTSVSIAGVTFKDNRLISVAAYGHQLNDGNFVNCIWIENYDTPILVDLAYDPDLVFGIIERDNSDEGDGRRRRTSTSRSNHKVQKIGNVKREITVGYEMSSKIQDRAKNAAGPVARRELQDEDDIYAGMLAGFFGCMFGGNSFGFGILNEGGRVELRDTIFQLNIGIAAIVVISGQIALHGGTTFQNNQDMFGPVFLDPDSDIVKNLDVTGENNIAMDRNGVPIDDACDAIFKEDGESESDCLGGGLCVGRCCDFGDETCFAEKATTSTTAAPGVETPGGGVDLPGGEGGSNVQRSSEGEAGGCDATCIVIATVVPVCTIAIIGIGIWVVRRTAANSKRDPAAAASAPPALDQDAHMA